MTATPKKSKRGRPKIAPSSLRTSTIGVRVSADEGSAWKTEIFLR